MGLDTELSFSTISDLTGKSSESLFEDAPCGFVFTTPDGSFAKCNQTFLKWLGYSSEDLISKKRFQEVLTIGSRIYYETTVGPLLRIQGTLNEVALDLRTKDEKTLSVLINSGELKDKDGKVVLIRSTLFEVTDRRKYEKEILSARQQAEKALKDLDESHEWFSTTLKSIGDAVITIGLDKTVSFLNPIAENLTGWTDAEAKGKPMSEVFCIFNEQTGKPAFNPVEKVLKEGVIAGLANDTSLIRRDGTKIIIEDSAAPIKVGDGKLHGVVLVFRDVTEKHQEQQEKLKVLIDLQTERTMREKFVATLTHDLRSPISAVRMSAQLILRRIDKKEAVEDLAMRVISGIDRADQMIQNLLDANRIQAGEQILLKMEMCNLTSEINETLLDLTTIHGERFSFESDGTVQGIWNGSALRRVIENLCSNAVKYGSSRDVINVRLTQSADCTLLTVHNMGSPIDKEDQDTLFDQYKRTISAQTGGQRGWGLGLTLVRGVVKAHGGTVSVESSEQEGTTFTVKLPNDSRQ